MCELLPKFLSIGNGLSSFSFHILGNKYKQINNVNIQINDIQLAVVYFNHVYHKSPFFFLAN